MNTPHHRKSELKTAGKASDANWLILFAAWLIATVSMLGSLFFSEVMGFAPCVLCWYQRIFMYPLVITLAIGMFPVERGVLKYSLPLAIMGWFVALYHTLLYEGVIPESIQPCRQGVSCTEVYIELFGFVSIPMLSLIAFTIIIALLFTLRRRLIA